LITAVVLDEPDAGYGIQATALLATTRNGLSSASIFILSGRSHDCRIPGDFIT